MGRRARGKALIGLFIFPARGADRRSGSSRGRLCRHAPSLSVLLLCPCRSSSFIVSVFTGFLHLVCRPLKTQDVVLDLISGGAGGRLQELTAAFLS